MGPADPVSPSLRSHGRTSPGGPTPRRRAPLTPLPPLSLVIPQTFLTQHGEARSELICVHICWLIFSFGCRLEREGRGEIRQDVGKMKCSFV